MTRNTRLRTAFWVSTVLFSLPILWSAAQYFMEAPKMVATMTALGYPIYFMKILGVAKVLGVAALLYTGSSRLKEWAYAGFTFDLLGASASHALSGDGVTTAAVPLLFLLPLATSYVAWHRLIGDTAPLSRRRPSERGATRVAARPAEHHGRA